MSSPNCIVGINEKEGPLYYASETAIDEKSDYFACGEKLLWKKPLYNLCYEISPDDDVIETRDMDEKLERYLKGRWNEDIKIWSSFLLLENGESKNFFTGLVVMFSSDNESSTEESKFESEIQSTLREKSIEIPSILKLVIPTVDGHRKHQLRVFKLNKSKLFEGAFDVFPVKTSRHHPLFDFKNSISKSFSETWEILKLADERLKLPEIKELLSAAESYSKKNKTNVSTSTYGNPFIVIEGLDGVGKTTLVRNLRTRRDAPEIENPPATISQCRESMTKQCQPLCRAFFSLGNYLVAEEIKKFLNEKPVILDRFWHSTAAYAIAMEAKCGGEEVIPPAGNSVYQWPDDLLKPTAVFFLELSEDERQKRLKGRGEKETDEESQLKSCQLLQRRLIKAYKNMENPSCIIIDASKSEDEVCEAVVKEIRRISNVADVASKL